MEDWEFIGGQRYVSQMFISGRGLMKPVGGTDSLTSGCTLVLAESRVYADHHHL